MATRDEEQERRLGNLATLMESRTVDAALTAKTDEEIATLLIEHVWADMELASPHAVLIEQAIERLRQRAARVESTEERVRDLEVDELIWREGIEEHLTKALDYAFDAGAADDNAYTADRARAGSAAHANALRAAIRRYAEVTRG